METYDIVIAGFHVQYKLRKAIFFQETSLIADINVEIVFEISFLTFNKVEMDFAEKEFTWKVYTITEALPIMKKIQIIDPKKFIKAALDLEQKVFIIHTVTLFVNLMKIYPDRKVWINILIADKAFITILAEYFDFEDIFFKKPITVILKYTEINTHAIDLEKGKQPLYGPIYSLKLVELEILKTYIKINLANGFIRSFKSPANTLILFDKKPNGSLWLYINYQSLNNITIKN